MPGRWGVDVVGGVSLAETLSSWPTTYSPCRLPFPFLTSPPFSLFSISERPFCGDRYPNCWLAGWLCEKRGRRRRNGPSLPYNHFLMAQSC